MTTAAVYNVTERSWFSSNVIELEVSLPSPRTYVMDDTYYLCINSQTDNAWVHQGDAPWLTIQAERPFLPFVIRAALVGALFCFSGLFSGLTLGLMGLDNTELKVIESRGSPTEQKYARKISPLRKRGNLLLCSLVLGNVLVNSTLTALLESLTSGLIAVAGSTVGIVILGEIIPQAVCSRYGLAIGAKTIAITKFFIVVTFPVSFPLSKILDWTLGDEIGTVYDREKLMEYIRLTQDRTRLEAEEVNIIHGALELSKKTAAEVMTSIEDVFMLPLDAVMDFNTMSDIVQHGYTRVPVYDDHRDNIVALLHTKDLTFVDPEDRVPLKSLCTYYNHPLIFVLADETLDVLLNEFKKGRSHMALVREVVHHRDGDPTYQLKGVVTLEDVIEEIIQSEIVDETDILTDNRKKLKRKEAQQHVHFSNFTKLEIDPSGEHIIPPQLALATFFFLTSTVDPFKKENLSDSVLRRLMSQQVFFAQKLVDHSVASKLYTADQPSDYFILLLEGRVHVTVGQENLVFEAGPFSYFGLPSLNVTSSDLPYPVTPYDSHSDTSESFVPDYTVVAITDLVYMKITRSVYISAYYASVIERQQKPSLHTSEPVDTQEDSMRQAWEDLCNMCSGRQQEITALSGSSLPSTPQLRRRNLSASYGNLAQLGTSPGSLMDSVKGRHRSGSLTPTIFHLSCSSSSKADQIKPLTPASFPLLLPTPIITGPNNEDAEEPTCPLVPSGGRKLR